MPVRHDIAPARESGTRMCSGAGVWRKIWSRRKSSPPPWPPSPALTTGPAKPEALRHVHLGLFGFGNLPWLPLVVAHFEATQFAVERDPESLERHMRVEGIRHRRAVRGTSRSPAWNRRCRCRCDTRTRHGSSCRRLSQSAYSFIRVGFVSGRSRTGIPACAGRRGSSRARILPFLPYTWSCPLAMTSTGSAPSHQLTRSK